MPVSTLINGMATAQRVALLPHHQVRHSRRNRAVTFGARVGFTGIRRGNVLHQPITVSVALQAGRGVKNPTNIPSRGCATVPLIAGGTGRSLTGVILTCHEPYSTAPAPTLSPEAGGYLLEWTDAYCHC